MLDATGAPAMLGLVAMLSVSITDRMGRASFLDRAKASGLDGVILPDLDPGEASQMAKLCEQRDLSLGLLVGPATSGTRLESILDSCRGFVYLLARAGITGESNQSPEIGPRVTELRGLTPLPIPHPAVTLWDAAAAFKLNGTRK